MRNGIIAMITAAFAFLTTPAAASPAAPRPAAEADAIINAVFAPGDPGGIAVVVSNGRIVYERSPGLIDVARHRRADLDTRFHIGSIGKQFTALALLILVDEDRASLDDPLSKHLPELRMLPKGVTLRRCLDHTSGLPIYYPENDEAAFAALKAITDKAGRTRPTSADIIETVSELPMRTPPGTRYEYNDTAYELIAVVIERLSGQSYQKFLADRIFKPLHMTRTFALPNDGQDRMDEAVGYVRAPGDGRVFVAVDAKTDPLRSRFDSLSGAGTIYSTARDMVRYDAAWRAGMPLVSRRLVAQMWQSGRLNDGRATGYGLAHVLPGSVGLEPLGPRSQAVAHAGGWPGFVSAYVRDPSTGLSSILLVNRLDMSDVGKIWRGVSGAMTAERAARSPIRLAAEIAAPFRRR